MNVLITGSSGMVGKGVLLECIDSEYVSKILTVNRRPEGIEHSKLEEIILDDFFELTKIKDRFENIDACFFCLGVSAGGMSEEGYTKITYQLTMEFATLLLGINPSIRFCYVSGAGTDSSGKSRMMWARVKGKTENDLLALGFSAVYMLRPGLIKPLRGIRSRTRAYRILISLFSWLFPILNYLSKSVTDTSKMGFAMIQLKLDGYEKKILEASDINIVAQRFIDRKK